MKTQNLFLLVLLTIFLSCSNSSNQEKVLTTQYGSVRALQTHLEKDKMAWWTYHKKNIILSTEFKPLDSDGKDITKKEFLEKLDTGDFIALEVLDESKETYYQLLSISENAAGAITGMVEVDGYAALQHFLEEGKQFPSYSFTDLEGRSYTKEDLLGKTVFIKTWFIACAPCIEEMPDLNKLVEEYSHRDDVVFISLALDKPGALKEFLTKRQFDYKVVSEQGDFIYENLVNLAYPTHFIIGPDGNIKKVVSNFEELDLARKSMGI